MKIVYMGTPDFAVPPLESLMNDGHDIPVVFTQPDRPSGRGMKLNAPAVKRWAAARGISVCQPETMGEALPVLEEISPDLIVVCAYGKIIPETILKLPPYGCVNIHASLLPKYRGAAPIQRCIVDGETVSGVTTMHMAKGLDTGDMIFKEETAIAPDDTGGTLHDRLMEMGARLIVKTVRALADGTAPRTPQNDAESTYAPTIKKDETRVDWTGRTGDIINFIRGFSPFPAAFTRVSEGKMKLYFAVPANADSPAPPGTVLGADERGLLVKTGDGALSITELQAPGGKRMSATEYLRGHDIPNGTVFE